MLEVRCQPKGEIVSQKGKLRGEPIVSLSRRRDWSPENGDGWDFEGTT